MRFAFLASLASLLLANAVSAQTLTGKYLEARNANMWAGPCVYNAEIGLAGKMAVIAWQVGSGAYNNVQLDGLSIVAIVEGDQTFGIGEKVNSQTVFIVDERADQSQQEALVEMARRLAGDTIQHVIAVKHSKITIDVGQGDQLGYSLMESGIARIRTRPVRKADHMCGNERMAYPTLAKATDVHAAYTLQNECTSQNLPTKILQSNDILSGVVANFSL